MTQRLSKYLLLSVALLARAAPAANAAPKSETATSGQVSAELKWDQTGNRGTRNVRLSITRAGTPLLSNSLLTPNCRQFCNTPPGDTQLRARDLNGDGEPEVLVDLYTGGAHCCSLLLIYEYDATSNRYERRRNDFGNAGYTLRNLGGGVPEIFTADDRFSFLYTSYLESARPLIIYRYNAAGELGNVTRRFRGQIRRHRKGVASFIKALKREDGLDLRGGYAAWQADNYLLGSAAAKRGWKTLRKAAARGQLKRGRANSGPSGKAFLRKLRKDLKKFGYIR